MRSLDAHARLVAGPLAGDLEGLGDPSEDSAGFPSDLLPDFRGPGRHAAPISEVMLETVAAQLVQRLLRVEYLVAVREVLMREDLRRSERQHRLVVLRRDFKALGLSDVGLLGK